MSESPKGVKRASVAMSETAGPHRAMQCDEIPLFQLYAIGLPCVPQPAHLPAQSLRHCGLLHEPPISYQRRTIFVAIPL